jgi:hypothetical protein
MASGENILYLNDCNYGKLEKYEWTNFLKEKEKAILKIKLQNGSRDHQIDKREFKAYIELLIVKHTKVWYNLGDDKIEVSGNFKLNYRLNQEISWKRRLKVYTPAEKQKEAIERPKKSSKEILSPETLFEQILKFIEDTKLADTDGNIILCKYKRTKKRFC